MAATENGVLPNWKKLWQLVSGIHYATPNSTVGDKLMNVSKELQDGILQFKKCSSSSSDLEEFMKKKKQEKLFPFTNKLQQLLDIESETCWELLCFYLVNEYRGSVHSLANFISTESNMTKLLDDIWGYYSLERMIVLKIVKNLLEFYRVSGHPYNAQYKCVIEQITLKKLLAAYIEQLEYLIRENPPNKLAAGEFFNYQMKLMNWAERKCREIIEILQILMLVVHYGGVESKDVKKLFDCFKMHSFGREQRYLESTNEYHRELILKITYSEVLLFLKCIDQYGSPQDSWIKEVSALLERQIVQLHHNSEHGPILLGWMLLNFHTISQDDDDALNKYRQFGSKAVQLNAFRYLFELLSNQMFKDESLVSRISRKTVYNFLSHLCDLFDADGSVARHSNINELLCELISWPSIAAEFQKSDESGCRSLLNTAMEKFPADFRPLSQIASALSSKRISDNRWIHEQLEELPIYTEIFDNTKYALKASQEVDDEYILQNDYYPFRRIDYRIPANTVVVLTDETSGTYIHFRHPLNFFNALHNEINLLFVEALQYSEYDVNRLANINAGITYLSLAIAKIQSPTEITAEMVHPTEMIMDLLNKLKILQNPPIELLANCLNVCAALLPLFEKEIFMRVTNLNILPAVTSNSLDFKRYANGMCFDSSLVGLYLVNFEKNVEKYDFLLAYLNFLKTCTKLSGSNLFAVELPGLIFLLRDVFPHIHSWRFQENHVKNVLYKQIMQYFFDVLQMSKEQLDQSKERRLLRDICVYSLLNFENGIILLKFVAIGNPYLQSVMENETNWMSSPFCPNHLVQLSMAILMQLLRLKTTIFDSSTLSPLETLIYTQPKQRDTLRIIPVVTSYMSNIFNRSLPILSCRLLRRIAIEFQMSLLACLDMESDQIRLTFLQKLPEELESDELKIAILEFVEACIEKQPGLTEAFFKVNCDKEKSFLIKERKTPNIGDSILTYMDEFLEAISKNAKSVESPLLSRILALFHALWKNNMQTLVKELMEKPTFWKSLCNPLLSQISGNIKAYSQLLNILGIELFCSTETVKISAELKQVLDQFLSSDRFEKWTNAFFDLPKQPVDLAIRDEIPEWLCRLQSFKDFVVILLRKRTSGIEFPAISLKILAKNCLKALVDRAEFTDDFRPFIILSEFYLMLNLHFKQKYTDNAEEDREMLSDVVKLLSRVSAYYEDIHPRAKESCLSIGIKTVSYMSEDGVPDAAAALSFLQPIVEIVSFELKSLEKQLRNNNTTADHKQAETATILSLNLLKNASVTFCTDGGNANWDMPFKLTKIFLRLLSGTGGILQNSAKCKLSVELLDILIVFAKGNCSEELLNCDISDYLWLNLLPPKDLFQMPYAAPQAAKDAAWTSQNWWPIYSRGIEFVTTLFQKHQHRFLKEALMFVGVHEEYLIDSVLLAKQTLEPPVMTLIKNAVLFIAELVTYEREWRMEHAQSMFNLMRCIQMLMDHSISLLYRPKILKRLTEGQSQPDVVTESSTSESTDVIVDAMNDLIEIIIISSRCLLRFSPNLLDLIAEPEFLLCRWDPLIEIQFGAPKLDAGSCPQLTFGTVLSAVSLLTKALNLQNYTFHGDSLTGLPIAEKKAGVRASPADSMKSTTSSPTSKHSFLKSMSVTSVTSLVSTTAANEFLSLLNGSLCVASLEHVLTFLASQTLLALRNTNLSNREKQLIRREISTELMSYHEYVRKKVLSEYRGNPWQRKKHGFVFMYNLESNDNQLQDRPSTASGEYSTRKSSDHRQSMRVNVVRRQHLQNVRHEQQTPVSTSSDAVRKTSFEMSRVISPITVGSAQSKSDLNVATTIESSTPSSDRNGKRLSQPDNEMIKKVCTDEDDEDVFFEPEEPKYSPLSYVKLVEEDYLHFLSNLFMVICHSD